MNNASNALINDQMTQDIIEAAKEIAVECGAHSVTVRKVLRKLGVSNRVFYNRFHNIEEVMLRIYRDIAASIHFSTDLNYESSDEFFEGIISIMENTLTLSYEKKDTLGQYVFEQDSKDNDNFDWWQKEIKRIMEFALDQGYIKENIDIEKMSYAIWCFIRGFNADAMSRSIPLPEALEAFRYSFKVLLDGLKP